MISSMLKATARDVITNANPTLYQKMRNATVKLAGGMFTGSGVIIAFTVRQNRRTMVVATAAHNLTVFISSLTTLQQRQVWGRPPDELTLEIMNNRKQQAIDAFIATVTIRYTAADWTRDVDTPINGTADITRVVLPSWTYDVCLLYADVPLSSLPMYSAVRSMSEVKEAAELVAPLSWSVDLPAGYRLLQAGYGRTNPEQPLSVGTLNFKISELENDGSEASYYDSRVGTSDNVFKLKSAADWTSLPGDSGGPLFAVHTVKNKLHPIGVALGSDVGNADEDAAWEQDADGAHNNAVTSLSRVYTAWDAEGGDPAAVLLDNGFTF